MTPCYVKFRDGCLRAAGLFSKKADHFHILAKLIHEFCNARTSSTDTIIKKCFGEQKYVTETMMEVIENFVLEKNQICV